MTRNGFLAAASAIGVVAGVLNLTSGALFLADQVSMNYLTALNVAEGLYVLSALFMIGGFATAFGGFLNAAPSS